MICAVIVTYNPDVGRVTGLINALRSHHVFPIIVDNSSIVKADYGCENIILGYNSGIAYAQNRGIELAINKGAKKIVFFDQDSNLDQNNFIELLSEPIDGGIAKITAPMFVDERQGFTYSIVNIKPNGFRVKSRPSSDDEPFFTNCVISSGTMVDVSVFSEVGFFREELFIDYVDTEWCLRADRCGIKVLVVPKARMLHSIGDNVIHLFGLRVPKHSPVRRYYRIRNSFYLLRLNYIPKLMSIREIFFSIVHQIVLVFMSKGERLAYLGSLAKGCIHGILGRTGSV